MKKKRPYSTFNGGSFEHHTLAFLKWREIKSEYQSSLFSVWTCETIPSEEPPLSPLISPFLSTDDYRFTALPRSSTVPQSMGSFIRLLHTVHSSGRQSLARDALPYIQLHAPTWGSKSLVACCLFLACDIDRTSGLWSAPITVKPCNRP